MKYLMISLVAAVLVPVSAVPSSAQTVTPIQFARGASSATMIGVVQGERYVDYRVVVGARQQMSVALRTISGSPNFYVLEPGSTDEAIYRSSMVDQKYSGQSAHGGAYTIRVYQLRASGRRVAAARFELTVGVTGEASDSRPTQSPVDALVPGTPYHATAMVRCRTAQVAAMGRCNAGVIRRGAGTATVNLDMPDGGRRTILFRGGAAVSSDGGSQISVEKQSDTSIVRIGDVEVYEIPDALIFGG